MIKNRVCIIGAGTAGLCACKHALQNGMEPIIFEQSSEIGGTWIYSDITSANEYGIDVHSSLYANLRTNLPKEVMGYPDFEINENSTSYLHAEHILKFLKLYAKHYHIESCIKFLHYVIRIREIRNIWQVIVKDVLNDLIKTYAFEFLIICNGHYSIPFIPKLSQDELFKGGKIHSHYFRNAKMFNDENVLILGAGPSGMDLAHEIFKKAKRVTVSHHLSENTKISFLNGIHQKPDVKELYETGATFYDNSSESFSIILYCTGYTYAYPFLSMECGVHVEDNFVQPLYKHCVNINKTTMAFIGLPFYVCAAQMMDLQAMFIMKYFSGRSRFPPKTDMFVDTDTEMQARCKRGYKKRQAHMMGDHQNSYYIDLSRTCNINNIKPVMAKLHIESSKKFMEDLHLFRNEVFRIINDETFIKIN